MASVAAGRGLLARCAKLAEALAAGLIAVIFVCFILQIVFRYALNLPLGWTSELSVVAWLWLVLWGASFVLKDDEEIRLDLLITLLGRRGRIAVRLVGAACIVALFGLALPASYDYVAFMKVERSSYLNIRFDWLYAIYLLFSVAVIARYGWAVVQSLRGKDPADDGSPPGGSAR